MSPRIDIQILIFGLLVAQSGCSVWKGETQAESDNRWTPKNWFKKEFQQPQSMAVIWSPDVLAVAGQPPTSGFGGRIYFYNERSQAIPVEGELVVHGYLSGDLGGDQNVKADKTFRFTQEQLSGHFSPSQLGASYSIWIPWDEAGGLRKEITLIPSFVSSKGAVVQGAPAKVHLPGKNPLGSEQTSGGAYHSRIEYREKNVPTNPGVPLPGSRLPSPKARMKTTTIDVPVDASIGKLPTPQKSKRTLYSLGGQQHSD